MTVVRKALADDPKHLKLAFAELGTKEAPGVANNPAVVGYYKDAGHPGTKQDSVPWCSAFAGAMLKRAGIKSTGSLLARSYLKWGAKTTSPRRGDVVVFKRGNSNWQGHVAFYLGATGRYVTVLGGNQSDAVTIANYAKSSVLGYRRPPAVKAAPAPAHVKPAPAPAKPESAPAAKPKVTKEGAAVSGGAVGGAIIAGKGAAEAGLPMWAWILAGGLVAAAIIVGAYLIKRRQQQETTADAAKIEPAEGYYAGEPVGAAKAKPKKNPKRKKAKAKTKPKAKPKRKAKKRS